LITIIGRWEKDWLDPKVELFMWKQLCAAFNVDKLVMVGVSDNPRITIDQYETMEEALINRQGVKVFLEPTGNILLNKFKHPNDVIYIFGNAMNNNLKYEGVKVRINTPSITDMFAVNAAAIVLADRL